MRCCRNWHHGEYGRRAGHRPVPPGVPVFAEAGGEGLRSERDPVDTAVAQKCSELGRNRLRVRLDRHLGRRRNRLEHTLQRTRLGERRRASAQEHRIEPLAEHVAFLLELGLECVDVRSVLVTVAHHRDEVAVPTAVRAERQMDVEMANARLGGDLAHGSRLCSVPPTCAATRATGSRSLIASCRCRG